ncbi:MAG: OsmC family protein [Proteobacteria bacterium]|nr:OsmC family protein [Pseudomonadota bacterium]
MATEIQVSFPGNLRVEAKVGEFVIATDQPEKAGGDGSAPTPFALFASSIATCAGFFAVKFCRTRNIDTHEMKLNMVYDWDKEKKRYPKMTLQLTLPKDFPVKYHEAILRAMDQCVVKEHIHNPPEFAISLV